MREALTVPCPSPEIPPFPASEARCGFSILKLLVGLAIAGVFAASVLPVRAMVRFQRLKNDARKYAEVMENLLRAYHEQFGIYPLEVTSVGEDFYETTTSAALMAKILGTGEGEPPLGPEFGIASLVFIDGGCRLDGPPGNQRLLDPWGNEFHVRMDANEDGYTGEVEGCRKVPNRNDPDPTRIRQPVIVWSKSRPNDDGASFGDCSMWIKSWE